MRSIRFLLALLILAFATPTMADHGGSGGGKTRKGPTVSPSPTVPPSPTDTPSMTPTIGPTTSKPTRKSSKKSAGTTARGSSKASISEVEAETASGATGFQVTRQMTLTMATMISFLFYVY